MTRFTRRSFVGSAVAATVAGAAARLGADSTAPSQGNGTFCDILRVPDHVTAFSGLRHPIALSRTGSAWHASGIEARTEVSQSGVAISLASTLPLIRVHLRWKIAVDASLLILGDAWERSYGDLAWRSFVPERALPWYFATHAGDGVHAYGVRTGAKALCFWQVDREGISLWMDVSNGGEGVLLGQRILEAATVISQKGTHGEAPHQAIAAFCRAMCPTPRLAKGPIYGTNDWYYAYGKNTAEGIYRDTELIASLSPEKGVRPFSVIDMGWEGNPTFPDMAVVAGEIRKRRARPGLWVRPLEAPKTEDLKLVLPAARYGERTSRSADLAYDPTIPEALELALAKIRHAANWKYELIKHDFSTYDLFGQWGFEMGAQPTVPGWHFSDRSKTNAEIVLEFYRAIRHTAGEGSIVLGCNTIGHLSAGLFEMQRTGDDTSGRIWERTRRMGVNTLAFRLPQHNTFFAQDADCVAITKDIPWRHTQDWLDLVARSGTALFLSPSPDAIAAEQRAAIREAFTIAASGQSTGLPLDMLASTTPQDWRFSSGEKTDKQYQWSGDEGCDPFPV